MICAHAIFSHAFDKIHLHWITNINKFIISTFHEQKVFPIPVIWLFSCQIWMTDGVTRWFILNDVHLNLNRRGPMKQTAHMKRLINICNQRELSFLLSHPQSYPDSKDHGANMGPIWGRQDPGGPHVDTMNFAIWVWIVEYHSFVTISML